MRQVISKKKFHSSSLFCDQVRLLFESEYALPLESLHAACNLSLLDRSTDQSTPFHQLIYRQFDFSVSPITQAFRTLQNEWLSDLVLETGILNWAIQRYPSFRFHLPGNISVFEFHKDSDYNHPLAETNHFLSITDSKGTASLQVEEDLGYRNFRPLELNAGESAILNTSAFLHGDFVNAELYARVSCDFRALPLHVLDSTESPLVSISKHKTFDTTDYFISSSDIRSSFSSSVSHS